ncbi:MAG: hypothetical protein R3C14_04360 [Caldilineaceae bacterium]
MPQMEPVMSLSKNDKTIISKIALLAEAKRNLAKAEVDPSSVISHDELKQILIKQREQRG